MNWSRCSAFVLLAAVSLPLGARAADKVTRYDIVGVSAQELRAAMNSRRPVGQDGVPHDAVTIWNVRWQYRSTSDGRRCGVASYDISLDLEVMMPRWANEKDGPAELVQRWRTYLTALQAHENGHKKIAEQAATAVRDAIVSLGAQLNCDVLREELGRVARQAVNQSRQRDRQYDAETEHGRTQGARFP